VLHGVQNSKEAILQKEGARNVAMRMYTAVISKNVPKGMPELSDKNNYAFIYCCSSVSHSLSDLSKKGCTTYRILRNETQKYKAKSDMTWVERRT
jgi:hypothetical protein